MRSVACLMTFLLATSASAQVSTGDAHWSRRAEGHQGARAKSTQIDAAIAAYQRAIDANPEDLEGYWKILRAYRFKGAYATSDRDAKKRLFAQAKTIGEKALAVLDRKLADKGVKSVARAPEKEVADAARSIPHAAELLYWDAAIWGEWALAYGKLAAAREGVGDRIKRESTIVMLIDPKCEGGGGARILGRLHEQTPRVPFVTGWASDRLAVKYLKESLAQDPENKLTKVWLAEAMVAADVSSRDRAKQLLRQVIDSPNDPEYIVEQESSQEDARKLLQQWR